MRIKFLGAAQTVTGSMHLIETKNGSLLVDCGLFQGRREESRQRNSKLPAEVAQADVMLLTHAHIDHSGSAPTADLPFASSHLAPNCATQRSGVFS